jgi:hypothetical protein
VWSQCADIDKQTSNAWTNEDPSHDWVRSWIEAQAPLVPDSETQSQAMAVHKAIALASKGSDFKANV